MDNHNKYLDETERFINDTREGKYTEPSCQIQQWQELRYDYSIVENVDSVEDSIMLYGLSR